MLESGARQCVAIMGIPVYDTKYGKGHFDWWALSEGNEGTWKWFATVIHLRQGEIFTRQQELHFYDPQCQLPFRISEDLLRKYVAQADEHWTNYQLGHTWSCARTYRGNDLV